MYFSYKYFIFLLIFYALISLNCEKSVNSEDHVNTENNADLVQMQIDLQFGFAGYHVKIKFNEDEYFKAYLSPASPLAGPEAQFVTFLPRGKNLVYVAGTEKFWSTDNLSFEDQKYVGIGEAEKYYMGLMIIGDSLRVQVQDTHFGYLKE